jgi:cytochrome c oxidase subunit 1
MVERREASWGRFVLPFLWASAAGLLRLVGAPLRTTTQSLPVPGAVGSDFSYVRTGFHYSLSLAGMLAVFAIAYGVFALRRVRYRGWIGYAHLALSAGGALAILSPVVFVGLLADASRDPLAAFKTWNAVSAVGYAMTLAGLVMFVLVLIDAWRRRRPHAEVSAALPRPHS